MHTSISHTSRKINSQKSRLSNVSLHPTNSSDLASNLLNSYVRKNIESFYRQFTKQEIEVFKYLMWYWNKYSNIQIPIQNLCNRFKLEARRIHYLLSKLIKTGVMETIKKGHTGKATRRAATERGLILWKAITKGFGVVKQAVHRTCADSCADSPRVHTNYISTKVDVLKSNIILPNEEKEESPPKPKIDMSSYFENLKSLCHAK